MEITMQCEHQIVYFGVVNIRYQNKTIGAVDVWRCVKCKESFCEEKQLGIEDISSEIGMPKINPDQRWAVMICRLKKDEERWKLVRIRSDDEVRHTCIDKEVSLSVVDHKIHDDKHWLFMVNEKINKEVDID